MKKHIRSRYIAWLLLACLLAGCAQSPSDSPKSTDASVTQGTGPVGSETSGTYIPGNTLPGTQPTPGLTETTPDESTPSGVTTDPTEIPGTPPGTRPTEPVSVETRPVETQPVETQPLETQPVETPGTGLSFTAKYDGVYDGASYCLIGVGSCTDTDIVIPSEYQGKPVAAIMAYAFANCTRLTSVVIPDSITRVISDYHGGGAEDSGSVFSGCTNLTYADLGKGLTEIPPCMFYECTNLTDITLSNRVMSIGWLAFTGCSRLSSITFRGTMAQWNAIEKDDNWDADIAAYTVFCTDGQITKESSSVQPSEPPTEPPETEPVIVQTDMPAPETQAALQKLEYALLPFGTFVADVDKDGDLELINDETCLIYDISAGHQLTFYFHQSEQKVYTDHSGNIYIHQYLNGDYFDEETGTYYQSSSEEYYLYNGSAWACVIETHWSEERYHKWDDATGSWVEYDVLGTNSWIVNGRYMSRNDYNQHLSSIGLTSISNYAAQRLVYTCDAAYTDFLLGNLKTALGVYSLSAVQLDIDGDGKDETVFAAADVLAPWLAGARRGGFDMLENAPELAEEMGWNTPYTGLLVADVSGEVLTIRAYYTKGNVTLDKNSKIQLRDGALWLNGTKAEVNWD